ncbi:MAG: L-2-amino-thiazoline-4-carboxylic acid hydrolase [Eubacteriales bacterium]|nr:L-2-amino-thiazoline-4-carboxylic acid hydrolase [Eubacteriales bacterium]
MADTNVTCLIEHHAMLFAYFSKHAISLCGERGKDAILAGMTVYGNERGKRMAANALAHGDELTTMTNQAYGEWKPDYTGQMEFGQLRTEPTLQTYIAKCAWCEAWKKHDILEYGKYYCVNVDNAVYQGYRSDFVCTPTSASLSWGGECCEFDWGHPLSAEENEQLAQKKKELGSSCMKDFNFHTAHLKHTISRILTDTLGQDGEKVVELALKDYTDTFGQEYLDVLDTVPLEEIYPFDS